VEVLLPDLIESLSLMLMKSNCHAKAKSFHIAARGTEHVTSPSLILIRRPADERLAPSSQSSSIISRMILIISGSSTPGHRVNDHPPMCDRSSEPMSCRARATTSYPLSKSMLRNHERSAMQVFATGTTNQPTSKPNQRHASRQTATARTLHRISRLSGKRDSCCSGRRRKDT